MQMRVWRAFSMVLVLLGSLSAHSGPSLSKEATESGQLAEEPVGWGPCSHTATPLEYSLDAVVLDPGELVRAEAGLIFSAFNGKGGLDLWKSIGPERAGTSRVKDFTPLLADLSPLEPTRVGARVFFTAEAPEHGRELWVTDGTPEGTREVRDLWPGPIGSFPQSLFEFDGLLYFSAVDEKNGQELWRSDGTAEGTFLVEDLEPGVEGSSPQSLTLGSGGSLYFIVERGSYRVLMRSNGKAGAVELLRVDEMNTLESLTLVGQRLFFLTASMHDHMTELWMTEGGQPVLLKMFSEVHELAAMGGRLYLSASSMEDPAGVELWRSDGTAAGTIRLKDLRLGAEASMPQLFTVLGKRLFFSADDGVHGRELWVSDGTAAGTQLFADLLEGEMGSSPEVLTAIQGHLFFYANKEGNGRAPWMSDGTFDGTLPIEGPTAERETAEMQVLPSGEFMRSGWNVFFTAEDGPHGQKLWALPFRPAGRCPVTVPPAP